MIDIDQGTDWQSLAENLWETVDWLIQVIQPESEYNTLNKILTRETAKLIMAAINQEYTYPHTFVKYDFEKLLRVYALAPPHMQENIEDIMSTWKTKIYGNGLSQGDYVISGSDETLPLYEGGTVSSLSAEAQELIETNNRHLSMIAANDESDEDYYNWCG